MYFIALVTIMDTFLSHSVNSHVRLSNTVKLVSPIKPQDVPLLHWYRCTQMRQMFLSDQRPFVCEKCFKTYCSNFCFIGHTCTSGNSDDWEPRLIVHEFWYVKLYGWGFFFINIYIRQCIIRGCHWSIFSY